MSILKKILFSPIISIIVAFFILLWFSPLPAQWKSIILGIGFASTVVVICFCLKGKYYSTSIQGIATLLGIGGTFVGIIIALLGLDFNNIEESIPQLLNGIYPAFLSSLAGVCISLLIYLWPEYWKHKAEAVYSDSNLNAKILTQLQLLNRNIVGDSDKSLDVQILQIKDAVTEQQTEFKKSFDVFAEKMYADADTNSQILSKLNDLNSNIVGDSGESLDAQILRLQDAVTAKQNELKESFDGFADKMVEVNMNALKEVIEQFNIQLQEQFGENFKQLNEAVGKILTWQSNYKETLDKTRDELKKMLAILNSSKQSMESSARTLEVITQSADSFRENADALRMQLEDTRNAIGGLSEFAKSLNGAADNIKDNMDDIMHRVLEDLGQNLKGISEALARDYKEVQIVIEEIRKSHKKDEQ